MKIEGYQGKDGLKDDRKWCWCFPGSEQATGPFDTKEEACQDAEEQCKARGLGGDVMIDVGRCRFLSVLDASDVVTALDDVLERMEDCAYDNGFGDGDYELFSVADEDAAARELKEVFERWATKHIVVAKWYKMVDVEEVRLR